MTNQFIVGKLHGFVSCILSLNVVYLLLFEQAVLSDVPEVGRGGNWPILVDCEQATCCYLSNMVQQSTAPKKRLPD
ncbi:hypothetical protein M514_08956 [Trichuris suis]|uniref:Uncharacterized protein n=1 Tax=Trichuris suis TaxID=68888 RepID=A0A085LZ15_9BILA|nr:hypothetical protein M513_08956 [Trichuris suis]KFD70390.1 hypothetical protein M514_08956 [Trichuris suis]